MSNTYKSHPLFNNVSDVKLQTWNRCAIVFNITADQGPAYAKAYLKQFSEDDQKKIYGMFDCIKKFGYEAVRKQIQTAKLEA